MARNPRFVPYGGTLFEGLLECLQDRFLLRPSQKTNRRIIGVIARAQRRYCVEIMALSVMSNHLHILFWAQDALQMANFWNYIAGQIPRKIGHLQRWEGRFWKKRYLPIPITLEEAAQVDRLRYLLAQGCKENLVSSPTQWPGINSARALMTGQTLRGLWENRTALYRARRRKKTKAARKDFLEEETLHLSPLPCWEHLSPQQYQARIRELVDGIEAETKQRHTREGTRPLGRRAVLKQHPHRRSRTKKNSPAPLVHAATKRARDDFRQALSWFLEAYRAASRRLRHGDLNVRFPTGCFPPGLPFIRPGPMAAS